MTIAPDTQRNERRILLTGMLEIIGDHACFNVDFERSDFTDVHPTAWVELEQDGLVDATHCFGNQSIYKLSPYGWYVALSETGRAESERVRERCSELMKLLKAVADQEPDSVHDRLFSWEEVPTESGLPAGWVFNALASPLLRETFPRHRINHRQDPRHPYELFWVPANFGRKLIDS